MLEAWFWACLLLGLYPYILYPLLAAAGGAVLRRHVARARIAPPVTVVISAYNEAAHIEATVRNKLEQDYDGKLEIVIASDGSEDGTDRILDRLANDDPRVRWFRQSPRQGKTAALNRLVAEAGGEVVVFSDANSIYRRDAVSRLVENFADPAVGYVTGKMIYVDSQGTTIGDGCTAYMRYENALRAAETRLGSIVGVDGGIDAVRKTAYRPMAADQLPLTVRQQGLRVVYDERAELTEESLATQSSEFRMRVRVALRALWALRDRWQLIAGAAGPLFAWQVVSHKLLRYVSPVPLAAAAISGALLMTASPLYMTLFVTQSVFWVLVWIGAQGGKNSMARLAYYFALINAASLVAIWRFMRGEKQVLWQPRVG
jgi:cellulose synthase/poly-beta-1,6-N-acetylglucosamine synthase-like glycosyltransferase